MAAVPPRVKLPLKVPVPERIWLVVTCPPVPERALASNLDPLLTCNQGLLAQAAAVQRTGCLLKPWFSRCRYSDLPAPGRPHLSC